MNSVIKSEGSNIMVKKQMVPFKKKLTMLSAQKYLYLLMLPGIVYFLLFKYAPMYGILMAFKDFDPFAGILGSPWAGLKHFERIFSSSGVLPVVYNTLRISILQIIFGFPAPIIFALLLNEMVGNKFKKTVQTVSYLPHFLSWVVVSGLIFQILSPSYGLYGYITDLLNIKPEVPLGNPNIFIVILIVSAIWKDMGYGSIIYLATISGINSEMYEAARIDGAGRLKQVLYITIPSLLPTVSIMFILRLGHLLDAGFEQIFNLYNPAVLSTADIIDTFVYRIGLGNFEYSFATAVGLCKSVIAFILVMGSNRIVAKFSDYKMW